MPPTIAANMMVLNAATVLPRCLRSVRGVLDELVVIDTGSTDDTIEVVTDLVRELGIGRLYYERLHPLGPDFFSDESESWRAKLPGPFTGRRLPADWAKVRNLALDNTQSDYVLKLDADDEALCPPENWRGTAEYLDGHPETNLISTAYEVYDGRGSINWLSMYDRMWRRLPRDGCRPLRWISPVHEYLRGKTTEGTLYNVQGLRVRDWRDSPGEGVRVPHRNLKVLLRAWEQGERRTISEPDDLAADLVERFTLGHEAVEIFPELSDRLLSQVVERLDESDVSMRSDCCYHLGRVCERRSHSGDRPTEHLNLAASYYARADEISPHVQALLCLHRVLGWLGHAAQASSVRDKILARVGTSPAGPLVFNCDLGLLASLRSTEL